MSAAGPPAARRALPPMAVADRAARLRTPLGDTGCDAFVVTGLANIRWVTGFTGSSAVLVVRPDDIVLVTDGRYGDQARGELDGAGVVGEVWVGLTPAAQIALLERAASGLHRIALEASNVTWAQQRTYAKDAFASAELMATIGVIERLRAVKDDGEVARLTLAAAIADEALADVATRLSHAPTEAEFALELDVAMRRRGADGTSFDTIVASGPASALPHHRPSNRRVVEGDLVVVDFGALVDGYHSDMTRTFTVGEPSPQQRGLLDVVTAAQAAGVAAVRDGIAAHHVDAACRGVIEEAGYGARFTHGTGHGIGLAVHEEPFLARVPTVELRAGNVVTVEPGVYVAGVGGVRVEDSVLVTREGCRPITHFPKDHSCLPSPPTT